jgi:CRISPR-associated protein Cmr6
MLDLNDIREKKFSSQVRWQKETHAGLWLDKYLGDQSRAKVESRRDLIKEVSEQPMPTAYQKYFEHWKKMLAESGAESRKARVKGRMVVGLGSESIVETSISLHRTYGVPYIPGSALKGLAANYARLYLNLDADWQRGGKYYKIVFGDTDDSGYITFFDALYMPGSGHPDKEQALYPDVITVHHPEYYQGSQEVPSDSDSPTPVPFLSATGTYLIALAAPDLEQSKKDWISITFQVLENALKTLGIGAKTSSGYGRMELEPPPIDLDLKKAEGYKREIDALINVAGQIHGYYQKWQQLESEQARLFLAQAIVERVRQVGREKITAGKAWYQELQAFLAEE